MRVLIGDYGHVDFDIPVKMTDEQKDAFLEFLKQRYAEVAISPETSREDRLGDKRFFSSWTPAELEVLLEPINSEEAVECLARSWMSVEIKRGNFLPPFSTWLSEKGFEIEGDYEKLIALYIKEKEEEMKKRRKEKSTKSKLLKCPECGLLHDPRNYSLNECYRDGTRLREIKVDPDEKDEMYTTQPHYRKEQIILDELFSKYPSEVEE